MWSYQNTSTRIQTDFDVLIDYYEHICTQYWSWVLKDKGLTLSGILHFSITISTQLYNNWYLSISIHSFIYKFCVASYFYASHTIYLLIHIYVNMRSSIQCTTLLLVITRLMGHKDQAQLTDWCICWSCTPIDSGQQEHPQYISEGTPNCSKYRLGNIYPSIPHSQHRRPWVRLRIGLWGRSAARRRRWEGRAGVPKR